MLPPTHLFIYFVYLHQSGLLNITFFCELQSKTTLDILWSQFFQLWSLRAFRQLLCLSTCPHALFLRTFLVLVIQDAPRLILYFSHPVLGSTDSQRNPSSINWRMVFRKHDISPVYHCQWPSLILGRSFHGQ